MKGNKFISGFDPIWKEDFIEFSFLSTSAFFLRLFMIAFRNPTTDIFDKSDVFIQKITKIHRNTIRKAKKELIRHGLIIPKGYHVYLVRNNKRYAAPFSLTSTRQTEEQMHKNCATTCTKSVQLSSTSCTKTVQAVAQKMSNQLHKNCASVAQKVSNPIYTETEYTEYTDKENLKGYVKEEEIPTLRKLYPFKERERLKVHLSNRGLNEFEIGKAFELIYPQQYTGRRSF